MGVNSSVLFWIIAVIVLGIIEGSSVQLVSIWFAVGAFVTMIAALFDIPVLAQAIVFLISSVAFLFLARPLLIKKIKPKSVATNFDMVIGKTAMVLEEIDSIRQTGRVLANGLYWTAVTEDGKIIPEGAKVVVKSIEGVKLVVKELEPELERR